MILFPNDNAAWLAHFAALHTDAEVDALDVAVLDQVAKLLGRGVQRRRFEKARAAAHARGATSTVTSDISKGSELVEKFRFTSYPKLATRLVGKHPEVVSSTLGSVGNPVVASGVAVEFTQKHSDDVLSALDAGLLHRLTSILQDAAERTRVQQALTRNLAEAGKRSKV